MNSFKQKLSALLIITFSIICISNTTTHAASDYTLTKADWDLIIKVWNAIEKIITKKWESYKNKYIKALKKFKLKNKTNQRLSMIIQEVIDYINDDTSDLEKIFAENYSTWSTAQQKSSTSQSVVWDTNSQNNTTSTTVNNSSSNIKAEKMCKSREYPNLWDITWLIFSNKWDMAYIMWQDSKANTLTQKYNLIYNWKTISDLWMTYLFTPDWDLINDKVVNFKIIWIYKNGSALYEAPKDESLSNIKFSKDYRNYATYSYKTDSNWFIVWNRNLIVNWKIVWTAESIDDYWINNYWDYYFIWNNSKFFYNWKEYTMNNNWMTSFTLWTGKGAYAYIDRFEDKNTWEYWFKVIKDWKEIWDKIYKVRYLKYLDNWDLYYVWTKQNSDDNDANIDYSIIKNWQEVKKFNAKNNILVAIDTNKADIDYAYIWRDNFLYINWKKTDIENTDENIYKYWWSSDYENFLENNIIWYQKSSYQFYSMLILDEADKKLLQLLHLEIKRPWIEITH